MFGYDDSDIRGVPGSEGRVRSVGRIGSHEDASCQDVSVRRWVSAHFAAKAPSRLVLLRQKGQITPALSIVLAWKKKRLDAQLPAQSFKTDQSTA